MPLSAEMKSELNKLLSSLKQKPSTRELFGYVLYTTPETQVERRFAERLTTLLDLSDMTEMTNNKMKTILFQYSQELTPITDQIKACLKKVMELSEKDNSSSQSSSTESRVIERLQQEIESLKKDNQDLMQAMAEQGTRLHKVTVDKAAEYEAFKELSEKQAALNQKFMERLKDGLDKEKTLKKPSVQQLLSASSSVTAMEEKKTEKAASPPELPPELLLEILQDLAPVSKLPAKQDPEPKKVVKSASAPAGDMFAQLRKKLEERNGKPEQAVDNSTQKKSLQVRASN